MRRCNGYNLDEFRPGDGWNLARLFTGSEGSLGLILEATLRLEPLPAVHAVGQRLPAWAQTAWDDYAKRFPPELRLELKAVKTQARASQALPALLACKNSA